MDAEFWTSCMTAAKRQAALNTGYLKTVLSQSSRSYEELWKDTPIIWEAQVFLGKVRSEVRFELGCLPLGYCCGWWWSCFPSEDYGEERFD
uniref:Uncharacterized protein n=1 Tax=Picea sitchensis TaxID=3332 RepID=D5ACX4_PICSI|nr:unknown [Picea sitchensis]